jgi:hypothetical protein
MRCELIVSHEMILPAARMMQALADAAPVACKVRFTYHGDCDLLMTYGIGHAQRRPWFFRHVASGRHAIGWDLGYWNRHRDNHAMRVAIDADHPQAWLRDEEPDRFDSYGIKLRDDHDPDGPIVLVGLGPKANKVLGIEETSWERAALVRIRRTYPRSEVIYRPKRDHDPRTLPDTKRMAGMPIAEVLTGASLVVCRHSNVAIDACIAGIPVACEDGAAAALYDNDIANPMMPTVEQRLRFLRSLAWWQWTPQEAAAAWRYLLARLAAHAAQQQGAPAREHA